MAGFPGLWILRVFWSDCRIPSPIGSIRSSSDSWRTSDPKLAELRFWSFRNPGKTSPVEGMVVYPHCLFIIYIIYKYIYVYLYIYTGNYLQILHGWKKSQVVISGFLYHPQYASICFFHQYVSSINTLHANSNPFCLKVWLHLKVSPYLEDHPSLMVSLLRIGLVVSLPNGVLLFLGLYMGVILTTWSHPLKLTNVR